MSDSSLELESTQEMVVKFDCSCCAEHFDRIRRTEERVRDMHVILSQLAEKIGPALAMIGQPGGIAAALNPFRRSQRPE